MARELAPQVVVVGGYNRDLGIALDRFPAPGETLAGRDFLETAGGKGSNQAIQAARCGVAVALIAAVGADAGGAGARALWAAEGIDTTGVAEHAGVPTGVAIIMVDPNGQNQIVYDPGANARLSAADVERAGRLIAGAALVVSQLETPVAATVRAFELARAAGALTVLNPSPVPPTLPAALWAVTDLLVANELEATMLAGVAPDTDPRQVGTALLPRVGRAVVITIGAGGAWLFEPAKAPAHRPALAVTAIDSTGAGDAFLGAFAARWLAGRDLAAALDWGIAAGALACTRRGVVPALATGAEIARAATG
ncbi:MAG: ribokinase [Proteobacteria bacterium]|nr:ribokinase [Pseudomonadota bacterium]